MLRRSVDKSALVIDRYVIELCLRIKFLRKKANYAALFFLLYEENCKTKVIVISRYFPQTPLISIHPPEKNFTVESGCFSDAPKTSFTVIRYSTETGATNSQTLPNPKKYHREDISETPG